VLVGPDGILIHYRKLHLFDREKDVFTPGDRGLNVARLPWGEVGVCICYDLRFVEVVRVLALKGADLVCVPTAWLAGFDVGDEQTTDMAPQAHGALLQANLDQVFMACASQAGTAGRNDFLGSSIVASPFGRLVAGPMARDRTGVVVPTIDLDDIDRAHYRSERITPRQDRRSDVYALHVGRQTL
jgi:predicted amidohydrolase